MQMTGLFYIILAVIADVIANVCLKKSNGFANKKYGVAFLLMPQALVTLDLSIAYAVWGALGILLTTCVDKAFFGLRIKPLSFVGIATMISGIVLLKMV